MASDEYKVALDVFEGPLDLLLYLIRKEEVDIYDIPIERITRQYMEYMDLMRMLDLNIAGEFLVMAATLMMIKSRLLLPVEERTEVEDEEEDDPRWDLVRQLVEYKKFKDAALYLEDREDLRQNVFSRDGEGAVLGEASEVSLHDVSIFDLISSFNQALGRIKEQSLTEIFADRFTVAEKIDRIMEAMKEQEQVSLTGQLKNMKTRGEMICTFLAVLELIKLRQIRVVQEGAFGDIMMARSETWAPAGPGLAAAGEEW